MIITRHTASKPRTNGASHQCLWQLTFISHLRLLQLRENSLLSILTLGLHVCVLPIIRSLCIDILGKRVPIRARKSLPARAYHPCRFTRSSGTSFPIYNYCVYCPTSHHLLPAFLYRSKNPPVILLGTFHPTQLLVRSVLSLVPLCPILSTTRTALYVGSRCCLPQVGPCI
ncbi:hypothetical protein F5I97DRAFT_1481647 [Phlebopus sp. FC_14]|nr:hypothetical protein F5I97DRAFT_1481647 [Phlebopus sp. FC_14]